jgi:hypothetical protein
MAAPWLPRSARAPDIATLGTVAKNSGTMRRLVLFIAIAGAVAYIAAVCQVQRRKKAEDEEAAGAWENEGGAPVREG